MGTHSIHFLRKKKKKIHGGNPSYLELLDDPPWLSTNPEDAFSIFIRKTCLYNFDPHKPHFYIVKLGFTGVYITFFLFLLKNIDCWYSLEPPW